LPPTSMYASFLKIPPSPAASCALHLELLAGPSALATFYEIIKAQDGCSPHMGPDFSSRSFPSGTADQWV
jgi:hypothetical protein